MEARHLVSSRQKARCLTKLASYSSSSSSRAKARLHCVATEARLLEALSAKKSGNARLAKKGS